MEVIHIHHPYQSEQIPAEPVVLALGYFDGVHRGHQAVIKRAKEEAVKRGCKLAVMSFNHHPSIVYKKLDAETMKYLSPVDRKIELMAELGVDLFYIIEFTYDFGTLPPQAFVDQYIVGLHAVAAVAGFDYTYGPQEIASMAHLPEYAQGRFTIVEVPEQQEGEEKISSTTIRAALDRGEMEKANHMLGYVYQFTGHVMHGDARGRTLGYPTANIRVGKHIRLPKTGVYVVSIQVQGRWYRGMASIGYNITFEEGRQKTVEVNILGFDRMIYGEEVTVRWHHFLRDEWKFSSVGALVEQLKQDRINTEEYFHHHPEALETTDIPIETVIRETSAGGQDRHRDRKGLGMEE